MSTIRLAALTSLFLVVFSLLHFTAAMAGPAIPTLTGPVVDRAEILSESDTKILTQKLTEVQRSTGAQMVIVTLPSLGGFSIETWGLALGNGWKIGRAGKDDGVIIIVAPNDRQMRIEVGYGLERKITDREAASIIERLIIPAFRGGNYALGFSDAITVLTSEVTDKETFGSVGQSVLDYLFGLFNGPAGIVLILLFIVCAVFLVYLIFKALTLLAAALDRMINERRETPQPAGGAIDQEEWNRYRRARQAEEEASSQSDWFGTSSRDDRDSYRDRDRNSDSGFSFGSSSSSHSSSSSSHSSSSSTSYSGGGGSFRGGGATGKW